MQVKVLRTYRNATGVHMFGDTVDIDDKVVGAWIEAGWVEPVENKLMPAPIENKASEDAEVGAVASEPSGADKPVRRKIKHRKAAK